MKITHSKLGVIFYIFCVINLFFLTNNSMANSQLSGVVIDKEGKPVEGFTLSLYITDKLKPQRRLPIQHQEIQQLLRTESDNLGHFKFPDFVPNHIMVLKFNEGIDSSTYELVGIKIEGITFYVNIHSFRYNGFRFAIPKNTVINSLEITVKRRMVIRGQVVLSDDEPLRKTNVRYEISEEGNRRSSGSLNLNNEGKFVRYLDYPGKYTFKILYNGLSVESKPIMVEEGQQIDNLVLKFSDNPDVNKIQEQMKTEIIRNHQGRVLPNMRAFINLMDRGVWAINPENRHAYKKVKCKNLQEAKTIATDENANLLTINDEKEQHWVLEVFGDTNYWIGLVAGEKQWVTGEPLTFSNWISEPKPIENEIDVKHQTILIGKARQWDVGIPDSPITEITEYTILEKEIYNPEDLVTVIENENHIRR